MRELQSLDDVFNKKLFRIPDYQRGYAWTIKQLIEFWEDLLNLDDHRSHYTGVLSIKKIPEEIWSNWVDDKWLISGRRYVPYSIVDGQQRLTTVSIFIQCLLEAVKNRKDNMGIDDDSIFFGSYSLSQIREKYIVITEPKHRTLNTYKFGYEKDNPSFDFLRYCIFNEPNPGTIKETFYTLNLENAKEFFVENIGVILDEKGMDFLENMYDKLTQRFLFNVYEIDDDLDVFVSFEAMNNRGKRLSDLELLKNRLIYLTTLYPPEEVDEDIKDNTRNKINIAWGEIYNQLGRNKESPLNDDEFLRAHWIMYFKYSRGRGNDYIRYLLDDYFSPKKVFEKVEVQTDKIKWVQELIDIEVEDDDSNTGQGSTTVLTAKRSIKEINDYVDSLKVAAKIWHATFFPSDKSVLSHEEQVLMDRINRVKIAYFRPLVMAVLLKTKNGDQERSDILKEIERFIFVCLRMCRAQSNYRSSFYYRAARSIYKDESTVVEVIASLNEDMKWVFDVNGKFKIEYFKNFISKKYSSQGGGFYSWADINYFLFEYEESLKKIRNQPKISWKNFIKHENDRVSIEHIYPQTATSAYWKSYYDQYSLEECNFLRGSLGNLLPLSASINSSLQNDDFPDKKSTKTDKKGNPVRNGYSNGSYSELQVAAEKEWTADQILVRGVRLLDFMEDRWHISIGDCAEKIKLLHLQFVIDGRGN